MSDFAARLIAWHGTHGRHDLPWQVDWQRHRDPYRIWLSEIMLQQTQVATVVPYYRRFLARFPRLADLAAAPVAEVMALWSGLGYYARARNLHACAREVMAHHGGELPRTALAIAALPGIGRSTANAIAAFCFGERAPILDGNVKRVLCRYFGIEGFPGAAAVDKRLWDLAQTLLPHGGIDIYIQAQMDLGATVCTRIRPRCDVCPLAEICVAQRDGRTSELPQPRPRRTVPQRQTTLLLLNDGRRLLFELRPPQGIWGGLLSLPELPPGADVSVQARLLGCHAIEWRELPPLTHSFTHFRLTLHPLLVRCEPLPQAAEPGRRWLSAAETKTAPLPAPIRKLLRSLSAFP